MKKAKSFEHILAMVKDNNPNYQILDLEMFDLTSKQLKDLAYAMQNNTIASNVLFHQSRIGSITGDEELLKLYVQIERKVVENFNNNYLIVTDYEHILLAKHVYLLGEKALGEAIKIAENGSIGTFKLDEDKSVSLKNWRVNKGKDGYMIFSNEKNGYYAVAYINDMKRRVALAYRGTVIDYYKDLFGTDGLLKADIKGVLQNEMISHLKDAHNSTKVVINWLKEQEKNGIHYDFSTTGHSLGGWLADISAYFGLYDAEYKNISSITFDSPGTDEILKTLEPNVESDRKINPYDIKTTAYFSGRNVVNSCNKHVGVLYQVDPEIIASQMKQTIDVYLKYFSSFPGVNKAKNIVNALYDIETHALNKIIETFDPQTGRPYKYKRVIDWPHLKYDHPKNRKGYFVEQVMEKLYAALGAFSYFVGQPIHQYTIVSITKVLEDLVRGDIKLDQYFAAQENSNEDNNTQKPSFKRMFEGHIVYDSIPPSSKIKLKTTDTMHKFILDFDEHKEEMKVIIECDGNANIKSTYELFVSSYTILKEGFDQFLISRGAMTIDSILDLVEDLNSWRSKVGKKIKRIENYNDHLHFKLKLPISDSDKLYVEGATQPISNFCINQQTQWIDFNGDDKSDLTCTSKAGSHPLYLSTGSVLNQSSVWINNWCMQSKNEYAQWIDFNGDGKMDLACDTTDGKHLVLVFIDNNLKSPNSNTNGELRLESAETQDLKWCSTTNGIRKLSWIDFNGDGKMDLVCFDTVLGKCFVMLSTGTALISPNNFTTGALHLVNQQKPLVDWCVNKNSSCTDDACTDTHNKIIGELTFADFNGDGKTDFICSDIIAGKHTILLSNGTALEPLKQLTLTSHRGCDLDGMKWIDFNGDGTADYTCRGTGGEVYVLLSYGDTLKSPNQSREGRLQLLNDHKASINCDKHHTEWVDFNGDNKADLICYAQPDYYAFISTGRSFDFKTLELPLGPLCINAAQKNLSWIDFNGDNLLDLACTTATGAHAILLGSCAIN